MKSGVTIIDQWGQVYHIPPAFFWKLSLDEYPRDSDGTPEDPKLMDYIELVMDNDSGDWVYVGAEGEECMRRIRRSIQWHADHNGEPYVIDIHTMVQEMGEQAEDRAPQEKPKEDAVGTAIVTMWEAPKTVNVKRFYWPGEITSTCPVCGEVVTYKGDTTYLSYPRTNEPMQWEFCHEYLPGEDHPDHGKEHEWSAWLVMRIDLEVVEDPQPTQEGPNASDT